MCTLIIDSKFILSENAAFGKIGVADCQRGNSCDPEVHSALRSACDKPLWLTVHPL